MMISDNKHFKILGVFENRIAFQCKSTGRIKYITERNLSFDNYLMTIAPLEFWIELCQRDGRDSKLSPKSNRLYFAKPMIEYAEKKGRFSPSESIIYGLGGAKFGEKYYYNLGDRVLCEDRDKTLTVNTKLADADIDDAYFVPGVKIELADDENDLDAEGIGRKLYDLIMAYRWDNAESGKAFAGFLVTSIIGGCLSERPMLWLLAPTNTGKSWLLEHVYIKVLGNLVDGFFDVTVAYLIDCLSSNSLACCIDEFEGGKMYADSKKKYYGILNLINKASTGDSQIIRYKKDIVRPRFSAILASRVRAHLSDVDKDRFFFVRLAKEPIRKREDAFSEITDTDMKILRSWIIKHAGIIARDIIEIERELSEDHSKMNHKEKIVAALTGGVRFLSGDKNLTITKSVDE